MCLIIILLFVSVNSQIIHRETHEVMYEIAGIFEDNALTQQVAFDETMRQARLDPAERLSLDSAHDGKVLQDWRFDPVIIEASRSDSYSIWRKLCSNTVMRPIAIFGPQNPISDGAVRAQCAIANIPHIQATWKPPLNSNFDSDQEVIENDEKNPEPVFKKISINFYPPADEILYAYAKLLEFYKWEKFAVLYDDDMGLLRVQKILAHHTDQHPVTVRRLDPNANNFPVFKLLNKFHIYRNIILDCHVDHVVKYLTEAREVQMVTHYQHYILISMDASTVADKLKNFNSNVTWLSLTNYETLQNHHLAQRVGKWLGESNDAVRPSVTSFKTEELIMDDIANHILKSLQKVDSIKSNKSKPYDALCEPSSSPWTYGAQLQDAILKTTSTGVSGNIAFNENGQRENYTLYINEIYVSELNTVGSWDSATQKLTEDRPEDGDFKYKKNSKHFIIFSRKTQPFFGDRLCRSDDTNCEQETADENFEGFAVDLIKEIFENLRKNKFNYTYTFESYEAKNDVKNNPVTRKSYGVLDEILNNKADLVVGDITITEDRKKVVDFSVPFMSLGISILYTKVKEVPPEMFSFLYPYTFEVWMYIATAYCIVSILLFVCSRISPDDWENPQPCDKDPEELENIWNFKNCTWLTMGSIMCQGCDILPKALGSRFVCAMWWFFAVIVCQSYIAQLSASMTSAMDTEPIEKVEDLAAQTKVLYGAIINGSTYDFFKNSKDKMYRRMFENMEANPAVFVHSNDEGVKRVKSGKSKYAFFMESTTIEYELRKNCDLKKIGVELDSKDYGIAMPPNSPFRTHINKAILELKEAAVLDKIKKKWWEDKNKPEKECEDETVDKNDQEGDLEMKHLMGAFVVLIFGLVICLFITAIEFSNEVRNIVVREQVSYKEVFIKELKSSLNFFQLEKPVIRNPSRAPSIASSKSNNSEKIEKRSNLVENFLDFEKEAQ